MREEITILDEIEREIRRHVFLDTDEKYVANVLYVAGTYFVGYKELNIFNAFPYLAFMSPEPASGKSRALKVTELLSCNSIEGATYTTAALLRTIDDEPDKILTLCLDEMDNIFSHGRDNADLIKLFNLGFERGAYIKRMKRFTDGLVTTHAFCPKAYAGLKIARIPGPTKTRTLIINMRPKSEGEMVERHIDLDALLKTKSLIEAWSKSEKIREALQNVDITNAPFLVNRDEQAWEPLLAIAKVTSDAWYDRALKAAETFTTGQREEKNLSHVILKGTYRIFRTGNYPDRIHTTDLLNELHDLGIPKFVDPSHLADYLSSYDADIRPKQMKIRNNGFDVNRNGYEWANFLKSYRQYISKAEEEEAEKEIGLVRKVEPVDRVDTRAVPQEVYF